jgi:PiT family inorganic phosphate transporter
VQVVLVVAAAAFALACGVNDGGALVALGLRVPVLRPVTSIALLAAFVACVPLLVGTRVASTLADGLVAFAGPDAQDAALIAILTSLAVVAVLVRMRLPTSLTLSTIGALVGSGWGFGMQVSWGTTALVVLAGVLGPLVGAGIALAVMTALATLPPRATGPRLVRGLHLAGYGAECVAYGANDGQRMLAVFALTAAASPQVDDPGWQLALVAALFAVGAVAGMYRYSGTLGSDLVPARPHDAAIAELGGSGASLAGLVVGAPLSMTQAVSGGIIGSAALRGWRRVRWQRIGRLALAWMLTLPTALVVAAAVAAIGRSVA